MTTPTPSLRARLLTPAWIPQGALLAGQAAHGGSWVLLLLLGLSGRLQLSFPGLAWVHLVALGYLTMIALAVLIHVLHGLLDLEWIGVRVARWSLLPFGLGTAGLVAGFLLGRTDLLALSAAGVGGALAIYLTLAGATLARFRAYEDATPIVVASFAGVLGMLGVTAALGVGMAWAMAGSGSAWWLTVAPLLHAHTGLVGWLSLLVMGVSMHTVKPITGGKSDALWKHIGSSTAIVCGLLALLIGLTVGSAPWLWAGTALGVGGTLLYLADLVGILRRARVAHRPPQAFLAAAGVYFVGTAALGAGVLAGHTAWQAAYVYLALIGWLGQMVNGHLYHIGIRVLATVARGEDDETEPAELLYTPLSWGSWGAFQGAVLLGVLGLVMGQGAWVAGAGACGILGWCLMGVNIALAWRAALRAPALGDSNLATPSV